MLTGPPPKFHGTRDILPCEGRSAKDQFASPYGDIARQGANLVPRYQFLVDRVSQTGKLGHAAGKQPVVSHRSAQEKPPWKHRPDLHGSVEKQFVHPTLLGESVLPFRIHKQFDSVLPVTGGKVLDQSAIDRSPGLAQWWKTVNGEWDTHKTGKNRSRGVKLIEQADHMGKLTRQLRSSKHRILYSKSGNTLAAARTEPVNLNEASLRGIY